jgi:hypothetical protein
MATMTEPFDPLPAGPTHPRLEVGRLWAGSLATAVVAALIALVGVLIVRAVLLRVPQGRFHVDD